MPSIKVIQTDARLAAAPELIRKGDQVRCVITAISNEHWKDELDQKQERANSIRWVCFGPAAENHAKYLTKGSHVNIFGVLRVNPPKDDDDEWMNSFVAQEVEYLEGKEATDALRAKHGLPERQAA